MGKKIIGILVCMLLIGATTVVTADWDEGDDFKMHYPQLPDPAGFDVAWSVLWSLGDDWKCTETGNVDDIHFWNSWFYDDPVTIPSIYVSIWSNNPNGPGGHSEPLDMLWDRTFYTGDFTERLYGHGYQQWMFPDGTIIPEIHNNIYQINIVDIDDPFMQVEGEIYWLVIEMQFSSPYMIGWKTTTDYFMDHAVWSQEPGYWMMIDGIDFAFVITGEPGVPLICCDPGIMSWRDIKPGATVNGSFHVGNCGDPGSILTWVVDSWPAWGTNWVFTPSGGTIVGGDPGTDVDFTFEAPTTPNSNFAGSIKVINVDDPSDYCNMSVSCATPRNRVFNINLLFLRFLENHPHMFPILRHLLGL